MPIIRAEIGWIIRFFVVLLFALTFAIVLVPRAEAQSFNFTFSGTNNDGVLHTVTAVIVATFDSGTRYTIDSISGTHTFTGSTGSNAISLDASPSNNSFGDFNTNAFFFPNGGSTANSASGFFTLSDGIGWTRNGVDYGIFHTSAFGDIFCRSDSCNGNNALGTNSADGVADFSAGPTISAVPVPGPLAGAGMLAYLAVLLMGLIWRRQWLLAKARIWIAALMPAKVAAA